MEITYQIEWLNTHLGAFDPPLEQTQEFLNTVGVHFAFDITLGWASLNP